MKKSALKLLLVTFLMLGTSCSGGGNSEKWTDLEIVFASEQSTQGTMTFEQTNPLELPNGKSVKKGDLKPMWQEVEEANKIIIKDKTNSSQSPAQMWSTESASGFKNADIYGGANLAAQIMEYGANRGQFINLAEHLDQMPDFAQYLENYETIKTSITAHDGGIYHIPYIAEIGSFARTYNVRYEWVKIVTDGDTIVESSDLTKTLDVAYHGYWVGDHARAGRDNVITLQNAAAALTGNKLTQADAVRVLREYIANTYPSLTNPSDLYLNETATYDFDELVALWRCLKLMPATLSKQASGTAKADANIVPYFTRNTNFREEYLRLMNFMGGQRVHGGDSYGQRFYLDQDGVLQYSYAQDSFFDRLPLLKQIADEKLIDQDLLRPTNDVNVRSSYYFKDQDPLNKNYGFMTFDFIASTTAEGIAPGIQKGVKSVLPPMTTTPVSNGEFIHFLENTRSIKGDGWGIAKRAGDHPNRLNAALKLFNFFFTDKGKQLQNYGPDYLLDPTEKWTNAKGEETNYPKFIPWVQENANRTQNGNVADFLRFFMGAQMPIGYQKEIGFELQTTSANGISSWEILGDRVLTCSYDTDIPFYQLITPTISLTNEQQKQLEKNSVPQKSTEIVDGIFSFFAGGSGATTIEDMQDNFTAWRLSSYVAIYREAYNAMRNK